MSDPLEDGGDAETAPLILTVPEALEGERLDKALAALAPPGLSRSRLRALIEAGAVARAGGDAVREPKAGVKSGEAWEVSVPPPAPARPEPEAIPLQVVFEDAHLIVVEKPAGMVVHPAPGAERGTLVNALLHHCAGSLSGIGGEVRPGIVHRIDKDTSGLLVVAKTDAAHHGLAAQFASHDLERSYVAFAWGAPSVADPRIIGLPGVEDEGGGWVRVETHLDRHRTDRKRMAVTKGGRLAVSHLRTVAVAGPERRPVISRVECRLETGRTHQIRVHLSWLGHPLVGDPVYGGRSRQAPEAFEGVEALAAFPRQALHAATLGFVHPATGEELVFASPLPADMAALAAAVGL